MKIQLKEKKCYPLSIYEQNILLPVLMKGLGIKKGKVNAVTRRHIIKGLRSQKLRINLRQVERIIHHIRMNDLIEGLVGTATGYYIIGREQELMDYEASLLSRETELRKVRMSMQRQRRSMFHQVPERQTQLF